MKITYSTKTGAATIKLNDLERRQVMGLSDATVGKMIKDGVNQAIIITKLK